MKNFFLPVSVFVSGAAILAIEILGTRILGLSYGVSLFLWSALIGTTLIALSAEAFHLCRTCLEPDGVLAINVWAIGWNDRIVRSIAATLRTEFAEVVALPIAEPPDKLGNVVLMASNRKLDLRKEVERDYGDGDYRYGPKYQRVHAWDNRFSPDPNGIEIVTDDRNAVDVWSESINYAARKEMFLRMKN
jgi:hypothetical protein